MTGAEKYLSPSAIAGLLDSHGIRPSKALGQNFLADANHVRRICEIAEISPGDRVIEIGPGLGSLTLGLLARGAEVTTIEKDARLADIVREVAPNAGTVTADAARVDLREVVPAGWPPPWKLVANLPYNVATHLFVGVLDSVPEVASGVVMVQREVADRLVASVGDDAYGAVSLIVRYWAEARVAGRVPPVVFIPQPKVESALVRFVRRPVALTGADPEPLFDLIRAGFSKRRKTLRNAIVDLPWRDAALLGCERAGIDPGLRAEALSLEAFASIVEASKAEASKAEAPGAPGPGPRGKPPVVADG